MNNNPNDPNNNQIPENNENIQIEVNNSLNRNADGVFIINHMNNLNSMNPANSSDSSNPNSNGIVLMGNSSNALRLENYPFIRNRNQIVILN